MLWTKLAELPLVGEACEYERPHAILAHESERITTHVRLASDGPDSRNRAHTLAAGPAAARATGVSPLRGEQLTRANPRFLLRNADRETRPDNRTPWHSSRRRRVSAALATARNCR